MLPADLFVLSPGYKVPPDLVCVVYFRGARNVSSNVRNDVAGIAT